MKKYALISVTDKKGIVEFAASLEKSGYSLLSTGGTSKVLKQSGLEIEDVSSYTGSEEILSGRVKTLHPKIHGAILFDRSSSDHKSQASGLGIIPIEIVVVNLYDFEKNAVSKSLTKEEAIEHIDIGGPCMLRAAAKNWEHVLSVSDPADYEWLAKKIEGNSITKEDRLTLAKKTFSLTSSYDRMIMEFMSETPCKTVGLQEVSQLRYGENPHQTASFHKLDKPAGDGFDNINILQGKELSYNNLIDLDGACGLIREFPGEIAVTIIKHTNPCGTAVARGDDKLIDVWHKALSGDPKSAFGGIVAVNTTIDADTALAMADIYLECVAAIGYTSEARDIFSKKKNLRLLEAPWLTTAAEPEDLLRSIQGGVLIQSRDTGVLKTNKWSCPTKIKPTKNQEDDLLFAFKVASHVKSNAIVYAKDGVTLRVGAGQMSRIDAAEFAAAKAREDKKSLKGAVMASDAFFPFRDCVDLAGSTGISAIIQPGGSMRDQDSVSACDDLKISMLFTGERHFRH